MNEDNKNALKQLQKDHKKATFLQARLSERDTTMEVIPNVITKVILGKMNDGKEQILKAQKTIDEQKIMTMEEQIAQLKYLLTEKNHQINDLKILRNEKIENISHKQQKQLLLPETYAAKLKSESALKSSILIRKKETSDSLVKIRNQLNTHPIKDI